MDPRGAGGGPAVTSSLAAIADRVMPVWFLGWTLVRIGQIGWTGSAWDVSFVGRDFWIYRNAAVGLLSGGDPWSASAPWNGTSWHFAAPPTAAQLFIPLAWLDASLSLGIFLGLSVGIAWLGLRQLGLRWWWLAFPPMSEGVIAANPQVLVIGLLLLTGRSGATRRFGGALADAVAAGLKVYAVVPALAERRWKALIAVAAALTLSVAAAPDVWQRYLADFGSISSRVVSESDGGLSAALFLRPESFGQLTSESVARIGGLGLFALLIGLVILVAVRDVRSAGWIAVPLLWPAAEYHLATMVMPVARRGSIWIIAIPTIPTYLLGLIVLAYEVVGERHPIPVTEKNVSLRDWLRRPAALSALPASPDVTFP